MAKYSKILLKLSGELLCKKGDKGINPDDLTPFFNELNQIRALGTRVAMVVGGGNLWRGDRGIGKTIERVTSDQVGMLATVMNGLLLQDLMRQAGITARLESALGIDHVCEPFNFRRALQFWTPESPLILAAGTGNPYFTTDTAAALRAVELGVDIFFKATKVDGVYSADPETDPTAERYRQLSYQDVLEKDLKILDGTAVSLCRQNDLPILVFDMSKRGNIIAAVNGEDVGTIISNGE